MKCPYCSKKLNIVVTKKAQRKTLHIGIVNKKGLVNVKEIIEKTGVTNRTLNYYAQRGLIDRGERIKGHPNHAWGYPKGTIERVKSIIKCVKRPTLDEWRLQYIKERQVCNAKRIPKK